MPKGFKRANSGHPGNHKAKAAKLAKDVAPPSEPEFDIDVEKGLRRVVPYWFTHRTMAKGRWCKRELFEVFCKEFQDQSPDYYRRAITAGKISVNNEKASLNYVIRNGDLISHSTHRHEPPVSSAEIKIVFRDENTLIVDKPPSIPYVFLIPLTAINRIDRLTSGILLLALNKETAAKISGELANHAVAKTYLTRVKGQFPDGQKSCTEPILVTSSKLGVNTVNRAEGRPCETDFTFVSYNSVSDTSVVEARPKTGRTHQIRVHLQFLGHPIANDPLYCNKEFWGDGLGKGGVEDPAAVLERIKAAKMSFFADDSILTSNNNEDDNNDGTTELSKVDRSKLKSKTEESFATSLNSTKSVSNDKESEFKPGDVRDTELRNESESILNSDIKRSISTPEHEIKTKGINESPINLIPSSITGNTLNSDDFPCQECLANRTDPLKTQLHIYLHSWKYSGDGWAYETEMPVWAHAEYIE
ncbi:hypothetical protein HK100_012740 [Physocladia obscura]|uniref:Pseudouridine synthase RsuA/RluA-like domain-containing protein n=1 Tax=Physocladia obscura TaxID=109957 RepID=A0AAD5T591_9FUNG|nr:hypothetical protein HK100_012740 [Physocladia obscura]